MAQKIFKGFKQEVEGQFTAETGYLYFVRKAANTGATDGYLLFNGKKYGTSVDAVAELEEKIGELPASAASISEWIQEVERVTAEALSNLDNRVSGNTEAIEDIAESIEDFASKEEVGTLSGRVDTIENDYLTSTDKTALEGAIGAVSGRVDNLELSAHTHDNMEVLNGIDANDVSSWADAAASAHSHINMEVLNGITTEKVAAWDEAQENVIEEIKVDGSALTIDNKSVNIELPNYDDKYADKDEFETVSGVVETLSGEVVDNETAIATLSGISADTRIAALEALSGDIHTHDNKTVLDGITAEKVAAWDAASAYTDTKYDSAVTASEVVLSALTDPTQGYQKSYQLFQGGASIGTIDIPKDMVVSSGEVTENQSQEKVLRLYIANTDPQEHVDILISDLAHVYTEGTGITIGNDDKISVKVVEANGLSVDGDGIKLAVATSAQTGAMAAADKEKLDTIAASAQTNVIEGVQLNGADLTPDANKKVNVELPSAEVSGSSNGVEVTVNQVSGAVTTVTVVAPDFSNTYAAKTDVETLSGSVVNLEAVSADTRLDALEAISADTRIAALEAISAKTDTALQEITAGDGSVVVGAKSNNAQSVAVKISADSNNALKLADDGLFAAIYYDGDDSE